MPKIVDVDKEKIIAITRNLINEKRYDEINCRSIAKIAGVSVGTLYNYFESKMSILASIMIGDWNAYIGQVNRNSSIEDGLRSLYEKIKEFSLQYQDLWEYQRKHSFEYVDLLLRHPLLIKQINSIVSEILQYNNITVSEERLSFISNNLVRYASTLYDYNKIEEIFIDIIRRK